MYALLLGDDDIRTDLGKIEQSLELADTAEELLVQNLHNGSRSGKFLSVHKGSYCADTIREEIPVEEQAELVVRIPSDLTRILTGSVISSMEAETFEPNVNTLRMAFSARNETDTALKGTQGGVSQLLIFPATITTGVAIPTCNDKIPQTLLPHKGLSLSWLWKILHLKLSAPPVRNSAPSEVTVTVTLPNSCSSANTRTG